MEDFRAVVEREILDAMRARALANAGEHEHAPTVGDMATRIAELHDERLQEATGALREAVGLLDNSRCDLGDPALRRTWGARRRALRLKWGTR